MCSLMRVLTWNILASEWVNPIDYPDVESTLLNATRRSNCIISHLKHYSLHSAFDIIALQEVMPAMHARLVKTFKDNYYVTPIKRIGWGRQRKAGKSGNVIMLRLLPNDNANRNRIKTLEYLGEDFAQCCVIDDHFLVCNVHLDADATLRRQQMGKLADIVHGYPQAIVLGDFNEDYATHRDFYAMVPECHVINNRPFPSYFGQEPANVDNILTKGLRLSGFAPWFFPESYKPYPRTMVDELKRLGTDHHGVAWMCEFIYPLVKNSKP